MRAKTIFVLITLLIAAVLLAGGTAFIIQQNKLNNFKRMAAQAEEKIKARDFEGAIPMLKKVEAQGGTDRSAYLLGKAYWEQGRLGDALKHFAHIESNYPRSEFVPEALLYRARYALEAEAKSKEANEIFLKILEKYPDSDAGDHSLFFLSKAAYEEGNVPQARKGLEQIVRKSDSPAKNDAEFLLGDINMKQLKSPDPGPGDEVYTIKKGDSLWKLERQLNVPQDLIMGINNLTPTLTVGTQIKVPRLNLVVVIDKPQRTLTLRNNNQFLKKYRVGLNRNDKRVPAGDYSVTEKYPNGYEYIDPDTNTTFKAGDPSSPIGGKFILLRRDLGIHGTNDEKVVGQYMPKGWIALTNPDIDELYALLQKRIPVTIKGKNLMEDASAGQ